MKMQIKKLFITSKVGNKRNEIEFQEGMLNFIVGNSLTGKTAIIFIIDYIFGSSSSQIPSGIILDKVDWFGLELAVENRETIVVARRNPEISKNEFYFDMGKDIEIPKELSANISLVDYKIQLDTLCKLPEFDFKEKPEDAQNGFKSKASFRDLAAFIYQPQYIIANPTTLFFKTESFDHREKLKTISELVLDIIDAKTMMCKAEIKALQEELEHYSRERKELQKIAESKRNDLINKLLLATRAGLLDKPFPRDMKTIEMLKLLIDIVNNYKKHPWETKDTSDITNKKLAELQSEERDISIRLRQLTGAESRLQSLIDATSSDGIFRETLKMQAERLYISEDLEIENNKCPFCESDISNDNQPLKKLQESLRDTEASLQVLDSSSSNFHKQLLEIRRDVSKQREELKNVQKQIYSLEVDSQENDRELLTQRSIAELIGGIEEFIELYKNIGDNSGIDTKINDLSRKISDLKEFNAEKKIKEKRESVNKLLSDNLTAFAQKLNIEYKKAPAYFDWKALTVAIQIGENEKRYLSMLGSGANWLSYHIAAMLSLAVYFASFNSFVPSFLIFDQPSQVYFPSKETKAKVITKSNENSEDTADEKAVREIFKLISDVVSDVAPNLQVIILEHADKSLWGDLPNVHLAAKWDENNKEKLVPIDW